MTTMAYYRSTCQRCVNDQLARGVRQIVLTAFIPNTDNIRCDSCGTVAPALAQVAYPSATCFATEQAGANAFLSGSPRDTNPYYARDYEMQLAWERGWEGARESAASRPKP